MRIEEGAFVLTKTELKALSAFASKDVTRPHLNCIAFDCERSSCAATDGHRAAVVSDSVPIPGIDPVAMLPIASVSAVMGAMSGKNVEAKFSPRVVSLDDRRTQHGFKVHVTDSKTLAPLSEMSFGITYESAFPNYHKVIPATQPEPARSVGINASYLSDVALVQKAAEAKCVVVELGGELDPVLIRVGDNWKICIMPCRV